MEWLYPTIWAVLAVVLIIAEAMTVQLVGIWLALGALAALIPAFLQMPVPVQVIVFIAVSVVCLVFTRPFVKNVLAVRKVSTNADKAIGTIALVTETIDNTLNTGRVMADGLSWQARSADYTAVEAGSRVLVQRIEGATLWVQKVERP